MGSGSVSGGACVWMGEGEVSRVGEESAVGVYDGYGGEFLLSE